jgi:hypothetical protein
MPPTTHHHESKTGALPRTPPRGAAPWIPAKGIALGTRPLFGVREGGLRRPGPLLSHRPIAGVIAAAQAGAVPPPSPQTKWMDSKGYAFSGGPGGKAPWRVSGQSPDLASRRRVAGGRSAVL